MNADLWQKAASHFAMICAMALADGDVDIARKYATLCQRARQRYWYALVREGLVRQQNASSLIDFFGGD